MVAYNFKPEFAGAVGNGTKHLTMREPRAERAPHARVGQALQLSTGARTKAYRLLLANPVCVLRARVILGPNGVVRVLDPVSDGGARADGIARLLAAAEQGSHDAGYWSDALGRLDGFADYAALYAWHRANSKKAKPDADGHMVRDLIAWAAR